MKLFARRRWSLVEGRVIDKRHIKRFIERKRRARDEKRFAEKLRKP